MPDEKLPPHDIDAEEAVIGSLLIDGGAIYKIASFLSDASYFYHEPNQRLYAACLTLYQRSEAIDQITVAQELDRQGKLEACGGAAYLSHLIASCPTSLDIEHYGQIVYRLAISRRLIDAARRIEAIGYEANPDVDDSLNKAEDVLFKLRHGQTGRDFVHIRQVLDKYLEGAPLEQVAGAGQTLASIPSNFAGLDDFLNGFQRSDLVIIAGRPSMGKTSFALSIASNAAVKYGACVALFSLEMAREPLVLRLLSNESNVDSRRVQLGGHTTEDEEKRIMNAIGVLSEAPIYIDDSPQLRVVEMRSKARRLSFERNIDLIIIDYLQLIQGEAKIENRVQEISYISRSLKALARELNVPVLAVSQLSRAVEFRASHRPQLSDLRESGSIEQDADVVLFIYRDDYYYKRDEWESLHPDLDYPAGITDIIIAKQRNGPTGEIKLRFTPKSAKFEEVAASQETSLL
ncbi:MAG: replicative DNA helicase [Chloroflexota bacterium]